MSNIPGNFQNIFEDRVHQASEEDIEYIKQLSEYNYPIFSLNQLESTNYILNIYSYHKLNLSEILPIIENLHFKAIEENTAIIQSHDKTKIYLHKFLLSTKSSLKDNVINEIETTLMKVNNGTLINDKLNSLTTLTGISHKKINIIRALTYYLIQTNFTYSKALIYKTLIKHASFSHSLLEFFDTKFNTNLNLNNQDYKTSLQQYLNGINTTEDNILRTLFLLTKAIVRTNVYQKNLDNSNKTYLSFKINSSKLGFLPEPIPYAEIFVYSKDFEGIHLRGAKVSRGGIRWSDRIEDYRTEVLGLMKAQMTKNTVIVPSGSKGGFIIKINKNGVSQEKYNAKVVNCYKNFLRGLLDLTDNIISDNVVSPVDTKIYDQVDTYLAVAADKGTANFSDYANKVSAEYNYWLGDAFASGSSTGYDHKKMGITAKGAWISAKSHFYDIGIDPEKDIITIVGIGDMSGDVFGNGLLLSQTIKLLAAFNHQHIFIDPNPNPKESYKERLRLFNLKKSTWKDYSIISKGGGIFERDNQNISITKEMKEVFNIEDDTLPGYKLIKKILQAEVNLIWNGGIGVYIKSSLESHSDISDRANDRVRCNGQDIRAKIIAEGGNLGISQRGRIEYSLKGGRVNTDFIDNSAGVDCSDYEVNIKILLNKIVEEGKIDIKERNNLLTLMQDQVEELVLRDNLYQTDAITCSEKLPNFTIAMYSKLIDLLEKQNLLNRQAEYIPSATDLAHMAVAKARLTRPELAVLLSYSKMLCYRSILYHHSIAHDKYFLPYLIDYFPSLVRERFKQEILSHPLRNEIIATVVTNKIVNHLGGATISSIIYSSSDTVPNIVCAYMIINDIFQLEKLWSQVKQYKNSIKSEIYLEICSELIKVTRRGISWILKYQEILNPIQDVVDVYKKPVLELIKQLPESLTGELKQRFDGKIRYYKKYINSQMAESISILDSFISVLDIVLISKELEQEKTYLLKLYFIIGDKFYLDWLRKACDKQAIGQYWHNMAIQSIKDDLFEKQRSILYHITYNKKLNLDLQNCDHTLEKYNILITNLIAEFKQHGNITLDMLVVANKKLNLIIQIFAKHEHIKRA